MSTIPKFASNKKYWQILNKLAFGDEVLCPRCRTSLQESYCNRYLWCKFCRKKHRPTSYQASWLYGMKLSSRQLFILLYCWQTKRSTETAGISISWRKLYYCSALVCPISQATAERQRTMPDSRRCCPDRRKLFWQETIQTASAHRSWR